MVESLGKRERWQIQCWGCERNHLYIDYPQNEGIMRNVHTILEETTVEYVGRNIPRIYDT